MGDRFARFRAAWGDTWTNPLEGLPRRDQGRAGKLAYSGRPIPNPKDAEAIRELLSWHMRLTRRWLTLTAVGILLFAAMTGLFWLPGHLRASVSIWWASMIVLDFGAVLLLLYARRRLRRTAQANGWDLDAPHS
jgi:hypothetical protein